MAGKSWDDMCIGIIGDGQLGRLVILRGIAPLGYRAAVLGPGGRNSPAGQVAWWVGKWGDGVKVSEGLLKKFCSLVKVVLLEWENVPCELVDRITAMGVPVMPGSAVLRIAQDRYLEKALARQLGIPVANHWLVPDYQLVGSLAQQPAIVRIVTDRPTILKTRRNGYDGKGQVQIGAGESAFSAWDKLGNADCILEEKIDFLGEVSVIVARSAHPMAGWMTTYGPFENFHDNGILRTTTFPIKQSTFGEYTEHIKFEATRLATQIAEHLNVHGLLAVEFFVDKAGTVIFNEMAPRPHNSGHGTMEWCQTDQFEQYVRAALNLPTGECEPYRSGTMYNVLGDEILFKDSRLRKGSFVGYGKAEEKPRRKMGHQTIS